jgi:hypothetical protein
MNKMRRKKINLVNLVNPVYFPQETICVISTAFSLRLD